MFSGKTEELIRRINRAVIAGQTVKIFKPAIDDRYAEDHVVSHNRSKVQSYAVSSVKELRNSLEGAEFDVVAIDEGQFLGDGLLAEAQRLADLGHRVIISGLDMDFEREGFGVMPKLMAIAEYVTKLQAICMKCGNAAAYSFRVAETDEQVLVGADEAYEARCRTCYLEGEKEKTKQQHKNGITVQTLPQS
jgi:thymidine kinase